jgi:CheY-like chemotaxis protein
MTLEQPSVLIIDDSELTALILKGLFERSGYMVFHADSGTMALEAVSTAHFDMIIIDYRMPGISGVETARAITEIYKGKRRQPRLVAWTADDDPGIAQLFLAAGATYFLAKPVTPAKIESLLKVAL